MTVFANDTFTGTAGTPLQNHTADSGQAWAKSPPTGLGYDDAVLSNANRMRSGLDYYLYALNYTHPSADYAARATAVIQSVVAGDVAGVTLRTDLVSDTYFMADVYPNVNQYRLYAVTPAYVALGTWTASPALAAGQSHTIELRAFGDAVALLVDGTPRITSAFQGVLSVGKPGVRGGASASQTDTTGTHLDTLEVADFVTTGSVPAPTLSSATPKIGAMDLVWTTVVDASRYRYVVEYKRTADSTWLQGFGTTATSGRLYNLTGGTSYDFRMRSQATDLTLGPAGNVVTATPTAAPAQPAGWNDITGTHSGAVTVGATGLLLLKQAHQYTNDYATSLQGADGELLLTGTDSPTLTSGRMRIPMPLSTGHNIVRSSTKYDLSNSHFHVSMPTPPAGNGVAQLKLIPNLEQPIVYVAGTSIYFHNGTSLGSPITYDPVAMLWLQIRENAGTTYLETSPDGSTWTIRRQFATFYDATSVQWQLSAGHDSAGQPTPAYVEFDNFNMGTGTTGVPVVNRSTDYAGGKTTFAHDAVFNLGATATLRAIVNPDTIPAVGTRRTIMERPGAWSLKMNGPDLEGIIIIGGSTRTATAAGVFSAAATVDVALVYDGVNVQLYANGAAVGSAVAATGITASVTADITIGSLAGGTQAFDGRIQLVDALAEALTAGRLAADTDNLGEGGEPPPPPPPTFPKLETLTDNFNDNSIDTTKWSIVPVAGQPSAITETNGRLNIPVTGAWPTATTVETYDFTASKFQVQVVSQPIGEIADQCSLLVRSTANANAQIQFIYADPTSIQLRAQYMNTTGLWVDAFTANYNASSHAWRRMREAGGTVFWEVSADGITWNAFASIVWATTGWATSDLERVKAYLFAGQYQSVAGRPDFVVDNVNLVGSPAPPENAPSIDLPTPLVLQARVTELTLDG